MAIHEYVVDAVWTGGRDGEGEIKAHNSQVEFPLAVGKEFQGKGTGTNPEELLASAVLGCYSITFGIMAANRKLAVKSFSAKATGFVEQAGVSLTYKRILIEPVIVLEDNSETSASLAYELAHKAEAHCLISNALRGQLSVEVAADISVG